MCVCMRESERAGGVLLVSSTIRQTHYCSNATWPVWALNILTRVCLWGRFCQCCLNHSHNHKHTRTHTKLSRLNPHTQTHTHLPDRPRQTCKPQILTYVLFPSGFTCPTHSSYCLSFPLSTRARSDGHLVLCLKM